MAINRNNFLRWDGVMNETPPVVIANDDSVNMPTNADFVEVNPFGNDSANLGIDTLSLVVVSVSDSSAPFPRWNEATGMLRIYRPATGTPASMNVVYNFKDFLGNASNNATIAVNLTIVPTAFRGQSVSLYCLQDAFGQNSGYKFYATLEKYYPSTGNPVLPTVLKPNTTGDPDYIAPVYDAATCPLPNSIPFIIFNNTGGANSLTVTLATLNLSPNPPQLFAASIGPGQNATIMVPAAFYDSAIITFTFTGTVSGIVWDFHFGPGGVGSITGFIGAVSNSFTIPSPPVSAPSVSLSIN